jgi:steroid delta-isomerase-like uncharacterized protein
MSNLEIVKKYYTAFNEKNWAGMLALLDTNVRHEPNQGDPRIGIAHYEAFLIIMQEAYEETLTDLVFMINDTGNRVAVEFTVNGIYKQSQTGLPPAHGQVYVLSAGAFLEVQQGKITRVTTYYNLPLWIKLVS